MYVCARFSKMELKRKISLIFVFVAMAAVLGHALIPHCHHVDGVYIMAHGHHHHCHHHSSDGTLQICANDHDDEIQEDCLSEKSFLKSSASEQIKNHCNLFFSTILPTDILVPVSEKVEKIPLIVPLDQKAHYVVWIFSPGGLRAPPLV